MSVPEVQLSRAKKIISLFFPHHYYITFFLLINFISILLLLGCCHKSNRTWRKFNCANVFRCIKYVPYIFISICCHVYKVSQVVKKMHPLCFSNAVLGILCGDLVSFRSGGSASGLRVHKSVRCNYEKPIPGKPVWHFIHDVSYGYLIHSSQTVQPHTYIKCTNILWQFYEFDHCSRAPYLH